MSLFGNKNEAYPLFNLDMDLHGWDKKPSSVKEYFLLAKRALKIENFLGNSHVLSNGLIKPGTFYGLHKYKASLELDPYFHMSVERFGIMDMDDKMQILDDLYYYKPVYTLNGLYNNLKKNNLEEKITALVTGLQNHSVFSYEKFQEQFGLNDEELQLKLLEENYKELVSNQ